VNPTNRPCIRGTLFATVQAAVESSVEPDVAALVEQTGHPEPRVREIIATLSILADAQAVSAVTGVSVSQALTARRQAVEALGETA